MKFISFMIVVITGVLLMYGVQDMPDWADPSSPASTHVSPYYLEHTIHDTATPNAVTSVLADYRGYDTLGETTVIFTAGMSCILILRKIGKQKRKREDHA